MRPVRGFVVGCLAAATIAAAACREPTQIELQLSTDVPCVNWSKTSIYVGRSVKGSFASLSPSAVSDTCKGNGDLGTIVISPNDIDATVGIRVLGEMKSPACNAGVGPGCIDARRTIGFLRYETLHLPILLSSTCAGNQTCTDDQTCSLGSCVNAYVDPNSCFPSCPTLGDAGLDATPDVVTIDASDAGGTCKPLLANASWVWHFDEPSGATTIQDAGKVFGAVTRTVGVKQTVGPTGCGSAVALDGSSIQQLAAPNIDSKGFAAAIRVNSKSAIAVSDVVSPKNSGWKLGVSNGLAYATLCVGGGPPCIQLTGIPKTDDGNWHTLVLAVTPNGSTLTVDGQATSGAGFTVPQSDFVTLVGSGSVDELELRSP